MRAARRAVAFVAALLCASGSAGDDARANDAFVGEWVHVGGEIEEQRIRESVEACVSEMGFLVRPLARSRLLDGSRIPLRLEIEAGASWVSIIEDDGAPLAAPLGVPAKLTAHTGDTIDLRHVLTRDALVQWRTSDEGTNRITYRLVDGGRRLVTDVLTTSRHLPRPVTYRLTYERSR
jgi:hypothetical protein